MAVTAQKFDISIGQVVEVDGRRYDVVPDGHGGVALEPAITRTMAEIHAEHDESPLGPAEIRVLLGDSPSDAEG